MPTPVAIAESGTTYYQGSDLPDLPIDWTDPTGALLDFSTGWTFVAKVSRRGSTEAAFIKTTGITGAATSPNVLIVWATSGELNSLAAGVYVVQVTATRTSDGRERITQTPILIRPSAGFVASIDGGSPESVGSGSPIDGGTP